MAAFTVAFWTEGIHGGFDDHHLVPFAPNTSRTAYKVWEVSIFILLAVSCGLLGALFNYTNKRVTIMRKKLLNARPNLRIIEATLVIFVILTIFFWLPFAFPCVSNTAANSSSPLSLHVDEHGVVLAKHSIHVVAWQCGSPSNAGSWGGDTGSHGGGSIPASYSQIATLLNQGQESAIKQLYSRATAGYFSCTTLAVFFVVYFCCTVLVYGVAVPSGLFVPCMLIGGAFGRLIGEALHSAGATVDPGVYALVGAAGFLGGVTRMTMSLACIILEISNDVRAAPMRFVSPLTLT